MTAGERYSALIAAFVEQPGVTQQGKGFGAAALKVNGRMFATLSPQGELVLKLPRQRIDALVNSGAGNRFRSGNGRPMKEWLSVPVESGQDWDVLTAEAMDFVKSASRS